MPIIIRCEDMNYDPSAPMPDVQENHGQELTTEKIRASMERLLASPMMERLVERARRSPAYRKGGLHAEKH